MNGLSRLWHRLRGWQEVPDEEVREAQAEARIEVRRAVARANRLWDKGNRLPASSNGRRKAHRDARMIAQGAYDLANRVGIADEFFPGSR